MILGKIYLQQLWKLKLFWDDNLTQEYSQALTKIRSELIELNSLKVSRKIIIDEHVLTYLSFIHLPIAVNQITVLQFMFNSFVLSQEYLALTKTIILPY